MILNDSQFLRPFFRRFVRHLLGDVTAIATCWLHGHGCGCHLLGRWPWEKPWKIQGQPMENGGTSSKISGKPIEDIGQLWKIHGKSWKTHVSVVIFSKILIFSV